MWKRDCNYFAAIFQAFSQAMRVFGSSRLELTAGKDLLLLQDMVIRHNLKCSWSYEQDVYNFVMV